MSSDARFPPRPKLGQVLDANAASPPLPPQALASKYGQVLDSDAASLAIEEASALITDAELPLAALLLR